MPNQSSFKNNHHISTDISESNYPLTRYYNLKSFLYIFRLHELYVINIA